MASMESFYGGRQGASFTIVKRFDGIDIPQSAGSYVYKRRYYAAARDGSYYYCDSNGLIERESSIEDDYTWLLTELNGVTVNTVNITSGATGTMAVPTEKAEGMRQCFEKGGDTTNIVNYGEYVVIDTITGLQNECHIDNGKVYRRGMNYDYNAVTNPLAGAEYIGQMVGPRGKATKIDMDTIANISAETGSTTRTYNVTNDSIIPGKSINPSTGIVEYNDEISYGWVNIKDSLGNIEKILIGFKFPYLVQDFNAEPRSAYYQLGDTIPAGSAVGDIIDDDFELVERVDDGSHPFYEHWKINVPHGVKGDSLDDLEIYPTKAKVGATIYNDTALTQVYGTATGEESVNAEAYDGTLSYIPLLTGKFISAEDGARLRIRYKQWNYDNTESGSYSFVDIGEYDTVTDVKINTNASGGIEGSGSQKVAFEFNDSGTYKEVGQPLNYILDTHVVDQNDINSHPDDASLALLKGHFCVYYSDPIRRGSSTITLYSTRLGRDVLGWVDLGDIRGETNAQLTFAEYPSLADIPNQPPEIIMGTESGGVVYPDYRYMGWGATIAATQSEGTHLALYDYINTEWVDVGILIDTAIIVPEMILAYQDDVSRLKTKGFVVDKSTIRKTVN